MLYKNRAHRYVQLEILASIFKPRLIVEVGTNRGDSAVLMCEEALKHRPDVRYVGYDVFESMDEAFHRAALNGKGFFPRDEVAARLDEIARTHPGFSYELVQGETSKTLHGRSVRADLAFIDGDHRRDAIRGDYLALKRSAVVVFDDYYDASEEPGRSLVKEFGCNAVVDAIGGRTLLPVADSFPQTGPIRMAMVRRDWLRRSGACSVSAQRRHLDPKGRFAMFAGSCFRNNRGGSGAAARPWKNPRDPASGSDCRRGR
jgi:hypothetical protein